MQLYNHQKKIIEEDKNKCGLWLGTGSGKTRTALLLAKGKTLVIAPKTQVLDCNWEREKDKLGLQLDLTVISKETFRRDAHKLPRFDTIIGEEAHTLLGVTPNIRCVKKQAIPKTSQLFDELLKFIQRTKPSRFYLATATPTRNPMCVWGAAKLFGIDWNFYEFRQAFYVRLPMPGREVWMAKNDEETKNRLAKAVQKLGYTGQLSDYFDVPEQTFKVIHLELTKAQEKRIKELPLEFPDPLVLCGKIHQVENGVLAGNEFAKAEEFDNEKIDKIIELAEEFPRMVVFAKYTAQILQIASRLKKEGRKVLILDGGTKDRGSVILEANTSKNCVFIAQSQVSSGWELPDYPVMVFASLSYSIVDRIQGIGRILRANALKKNLYIDLIVKGRVDEAVYKCIQNKKDFSERIYCDIK